ncbi:tryptophan 2,3-dioxygenase family protein [Longirhabdus pacifica]|uniref:tryptophan 2,3-dioxygenase family protein n=1 Tax=Longirhabdus pacifica TaxID=2305227 RepID=UPI001008D092|nr:tryptophan 2,3-dioxygenase family protein [Longirhabdus pacifica]
MSNVLSDYEKYIRTEQLLQLQKTDDELCCEDELTFQMVHQIAELHFKLVLQYMDLAEKSMIQQQVFQAIQQLQRIHMHVHHLPQVFSMVKVISPMDYHTIRLALGRGSGQDSPGFNQILQEGPKLWKPFAALLKQEELTPLSLHKQSKQHPQLFQCMQALIQFDEGFQSFRHHHLQIVKRMIGLETKSLKGIPAQMLEKGVRQTFYPELWEAICELTEFTGSSYNAKPLED